MFAIIFAFGVILTHVTAELPSYIQVCSRKDTNYNQCIANSINNVRAKACAGFPELSIPPGEPINVDKVVIFDASDIKLYLRDMKLYRFCDYVVKSVNADPEKLHFDINFSLPRIYSNATYDFDIRLLVPISHKGPLEMTADNVGFNVSLDLKVITRKGKKYIFASKAISKADFKTYHYTFNEDEKELAQLHEVLNDVIAKNIEEVLKAIISVVEERVSRFIISTFNGIAFNHYEEIFPEET